MSEEIKKLIATLERKRAASANEAVVFQTPTGKALARGRAYAYNDALKEVYLCLKLKLPRWPIDDEYEKGGLY